jgi:type I restriction enzyme M protein
MQTDLSLSRDDGDRAAADPTADESGLPLADGFLLDYISGAKAVRDTPKEQVRQRVARALFHEYGVSADDMAADFPVRVNGKQKKLDIAIFHAGQPHRLDHLSRAVVCRPEPQVGRNVARIRDYDQAQKDLEELQAIMGAVEGCQYGLWTNGLEFFYLEKRLTRFDVVFEPIGAWPPADESLGTLDVLSRAHTARADVEMLRTAFRRCHNFIHGNEGMPKDATFWQFLYLIFAKMHDERASRAAPQTRRFWAGPRDQFTDEGRAAIRGRIAPLFDEVKREYRDIFGGNEELTLSDRALAFMVSELAKYDFSRSDVDAKGAAYQEIVQTNLRGDRGQYFTPKGAVKLAVAILDPGEDERVLDPACGTGGFLVATLGHLLERFRQEANVSAQTENTEEFRAIEGRLRWYAEQQIFGADFDPFLIRASQMNVVMAGDGRGHLYNINSLEFPAGHLADLARAVPEIPLGSMDVVMTNPPFGADIPITDENILRQYELAYAWEPAGDGTFRSTTRRLVLPRFDGHLILWGNAPAHRQEVPTDGAARPCPVWPGVPRPGRRTRPRPRPRARPSSA